MFALLASLFIWAPCANAGPSIIFKPDGSMATVLMMGAQGDPDATSLYNSLSIPPEDFNGKWVKKLTVLGADGNHALDIDCVFSKMLPNVGTCTVIFHRSPDVVEISVPENRARLWLSDEAAKKFAQNFLVREDSTVIFRSINGRLNIAVARDQGQVTDFVIDWNGKAWSKLKYSN